MVQVEFGYYPEALEFSVGQLEVTTLPGLQETVTRVTKSDGVDRDWIFAPSQRVNERIFGLPKTHALQHPSAGTEEAGFIIWCLAFLTGMRLTPEEAGFLDCTPLKPGAYHDILWSRDSLPRAVEIAQQFWSMHGASPAAKAVTAVIHSLFLSQSPHLLCYERFIYLYIALDGCHFTRSTMLGRNPVRARHSERIAALCDEFDMPVPTWADPQACEVASYRNQAIHEGLFFGEPLGFRLYGAGNAPDRSGAELLEMEKLTCRFLVALLGLPVDQYIRSAVDDRQVHGVTL